jgi:predicted kinase
MSDVRSWASGAEDLAGANEIRRRTDELRPSLISATMRAMNRHLIHLVCGSTGAGKTTYSLQLASHLNGVRFSIDEWMSALFWMDSPQPVQAAWSLERVARCYGQIWSTAAQVAGCGTPCVLDLGFTQASSRAKFYERARAAGLTAQLHFVDVPKHERWRRVAERNSGKGGAQQLAFAVTRDMFEFVEGMWEPPDSHEMSAHDGVNTALAAAP